MKKLWRLWAKALGEKSGSSDREANYIAAIRTLVFITYLITNIAIVANAVRHWGDTPCQGTVSRPLPSGGNTLY